MNRKVLVMVVGLLMITGAVLAQGNVVVPYILKAPAPITVDGVLDEWSFAFPVDFNTGIHRNWMRSVVSGWAAQDDEDCSGTLYQMYDDDNFYFAAKVMDDEPGHFSDASWASDAIEFYMCNWDVGKDKVIPTETSLGWVDDATTGDYGFQLSFAFDVSLDSIAINAWYGPPAVLVGAQVVYQITDDGYILEGLIPLASLTSVATGNTFAFTEGTRIPFAWSLYDIDESENSAEFSGYAYGKDGYPQHLGPSPGWTVCDVLGPARGEVWETEAQFDFVSPYIKKAADPITVDGVLDEWNFCFPVDFNQDVMTGVMRPVVAGWVSEDDADCSGTLYQMYDADNFYFAAEVMDDEPGHFSDASWASDAIEYYLCNWDIGDAIVPTETSLGWIDDAATGDYGFQLSFAFDISLDSIAINAWYGPPTVLAGAQVVYQVTDDGYILEGTIPLASITSTATGNIFAFTEGMRIPFAWSLYDIDEDENSTNFKGYAYGKDGFPQHLGPSPGWQYCDVKGLDFVDYITSTGVEKTGTQLPRSFDMVNAPNPFNPATDIHFNLAKSGNVNLKVYDTSGRLMTTVLNGVNYSAGSHFVPVNLSSLSSGCYIAVLEQGQQRITHKMLLMK
jgi:hypothetical protein